jgi:uncharacterized repeat protein (TIGR01451 family)
MWSRREVRRAGERARRPLLEALEGRALLATVTTVADSGPGSLREAIGLVNSDPNDNTIAFSIAGAGVQTIALQSELPALTQPVTIDGSTQPGTGSTPLIELDGSAAGATSRGLVLLGGNSTVRSLAINRFGSHAILVQSSSGNRLEGNVLGLDPAATVARPNGGAGVFLDQASANTIGGTTAGARNTIGGNNGGGILIAGANARLNLIQGNVIGTNPGGTLDLGNTGDGIQINGASNNTIGSPSVTAGGNTIAFNTGSGVHVLSGSGNQISRNSMFLNDGVGIQLDPGANNNIVAPTLGLATTTGGVTSVTGTITGAAGTYTVDFYSNTAEAGSNAVEGRTFVGSTTVTITPAAGSTTGTANFTGSLSAVALNNLVVATVTDAANNTSAFSAPVTNTVPTANVGITGTRTPEPVAQNGVLTYTYTITNGGPSAATVTFTDPLPNTVSFVQATSSVGSVSRTGNTVTVALGSLAANATATVTVQVVPTAVGTITNTATISAPEDPDSSNNSVTLTSTSQSGVDLLLTADAETVPAVVGQNWEVRFVVTNNGPAAATNVNIAGFIPDNLPLVSVTTTQGTVDLRADRKFYNALIGNLAAGASARVTVVVTPGAVGVAQLSAITGSSQPEINPANNSTFAGARIVQANPNPPDTLPPFVDRLSRFGVHGQSTSLLVGFTEPVEESTVENLQNYRLVTAGPDGRFGTRDDRRLAIDSATYSGVNRAVTLNLLRRLPLSTRVQLTVVGVRPDGIVDLDGNFLAGSDGIPGTNFVRVFSGRGPGSLTGAVAQALRVRNTTR